MTSQPAGTIPQWTLAERLRKAREDADLEQGQLAETMTIARTSVINYEKGHTTPRPYILKEWALVTGVPLWWLKGEPNPGTRENPADSLAQVFDIAAHGGHDGTTAPLPLAS